MYMLEDWNQFKYKDSPNTFNWYKIPAKEHQVAHNWLPDEIQALRTLLCKCQEYVPLIFSIIYMAEQL